MDKFVYTSLLLILVSNNAYTQYTVGLPIQAPSQIPKQQLITYLLSSLNQEPLAERIGVLTTAVQQMPPRKNRRVYLADMLKKSALQSLLVALSVCEATASGPSFPERVAPLKGYAAPLPPNLGINPTEALIANTKFLASLLPRELLSSLFAGDGSNRYSKSSWL